MLTCDMIYQCYQELSIITYAEMSQILPVSSLHTLMTQYRKLESRPIYLMAKKRLRRVVQEWQAVADAKKASRQQLAAVQKSANHKVMRTAWLSW